MEKTRKKKEAGRRATYRGWVGGERMRREGFNSRTGELEGSNISEEDFLVSLRHRLGLYVAPPHKINDAESPHWVFLVYSSCSMHVAAGCCLRRPSTARVEVVVVENLSLQKKRKKKEP
jgi:hypothetical protein